jgi:hypothetical protein
VGHKRRQQGNPQPGAHHGQRLVEAIGANHHRALGQVVGQPAFELEVARVALESDPIFLF